MFVLSHKLVGLEAQIKTLHQRVSVLEAELKAAQWRELFSVADSRRLAKILNRQKKSRSVYGPASDGWSGDLVRVKLIKDAPGLAWATDVYGLQRVIELYFVSELVSILKGEAS